MAFNLGRYGSKPWTLTALGLASLLIVLLVPYGFDQEADKGDKTASYDDVTENNFLEGIANYEMALTGAIMVLAAGALMLLFGYVQMETMPARLLGAGTAIVAGLGGLMAFTTSMIHVNVGYTDFFNNFMSEWKMDGYLVSPVLMVILGAVVVTKVSEMIAALAPAGELRTSSTQRNGFTGLLLLSLGIAMLVSWSFLKGAGDADSQFVASYEAFFDGTPLGSLGTFLTFAAATLWTCIMLTWVRQTMDATFEQNDNTTMINAIVGLVQFGLFAAWAIYYIVACATLYKPENPGGADFLPGWTNFAMIPFLIFWGLRTYPEAREGLGVLQSSSADAGALDA